MKEFRVEENLGILSLEQFFELFFEGDSFSYQWHEKRGNTDIHLGPWTKAPDGNRKQRLIRYTPPPAAHPMLKRFTSNSKFKEVLHFHITPRGEAVVTAVTMGEGGASVDLETRVEWTASINEDGTLHCTIIGRDEYKRKLFKEMMENFMRESTEASIQLWVELVRRHMHHLGLSSPAVLHASSAHPTHPSSSDDEFEDEDGASEESGEQPDRHHLLRPQQQQQQQHSLLHRRDDTQHKAVGQEEEIEETDDDDDEDDSRFVDAREVLVLGEHGVNTAEEVVVLRAAVKGLEREVSNLERQLTKALTRVAGLQQTLQEVTGDTFSVADANGGGGAGLSLSLPSLHQRLAALEHAQATADLAAATAAASHSSALNSSATNGAPPTPDELEQAVQDIEIERRLARRRRHRGESRNGLSTSTPNGDTLIVGLPSASPASMPPPLPSTSTSTSTSSPSTSSSSSTSLAPSSSSSSAKPMAAKRRKLMWAGVMALAVLSLSLALPTLLGPRAPRLFDRFGVLVRSLAFWPFARSSSSSSAASSPAQP